MTRYIKIDENNIPTNVFNDSSRYLFDGTEIYLDDNWDSTIYNGKEIFNEYEVAQFTWDPTEKILIERNQSEIDNDPSFITYYKKLKKEELNKYVGDNLLDVIKPGIRSLEDIVTAWNSFKTNASSWTTKQQVDNAFDTSINWLNS